MEQRQLENVLGTVCALLQADGISEAAELVRAYPARAMQSGHDNWNGGTTLWDVLLEMPASDFARLGARRQQLEEQISTRLKTVLEPLTNDWYSVKAVPAIAQDTDWRAASSGVPREVRQNIFDGIRLENIEWYGSLHDVEFLSRLYQLETLPSTDPRYKDASGDIWQHRVNNDDWERDWVFSDSRFRLLDGPTDTFLRFLCEVIHPVVRPEKDQALRIVGHFNEQLRLAGWELYEEQRIAGRSRYAYRRLAQHGARAAFRARTVAEALDAGWMEKEIERLENAVESDPALAIGTAKELVETCCKSILTKLGLTFSKGADLGELTKMVATELKLVPEGITDEARGADNIRLILRNLTALTNNLAQLRGLYGTGHGRDGKHRGLGPRHARLAVGSAVVFIDFVADTYRQREAKGTESVKP